MYCIMYSSDRPIYRPAYIIGRYVFFTCIFFPGMIYRHFNKCSFLELRLVTFVVIVIFMINEYRGSKSSVGSKYLLRKIGIGVSAIG